MHMNTRARRHTYTPRTFFCFSGRHRRGEGGLELQKADCVEHRPEILDENVQHQSGPSGGHGELTLDQLRHLWVQGSL